MNTKPGTRLTWLYLLTQGVSGFLWWVWLAIDPESRRYFVPDHLPSSFILAFAIPDLALFVLGSVITGAAFAMRLSIGSALLWGLSGVMLYATLLCVGFQIQFGGYQSPTLIMLAGTACTLSLAFTSKPTDPVYPTIKFRVLKARGPRHALIRTLVQVVIFWTVFLWLFPHAILFVERGVGIDGFGQVIWIGIGLFLPASGLGLASAWAMSKHGLGTPLPTEAAPKLVTRGPYRVVRNPMVVAGLLQGLGVMLILGSWLMLPYIVLGGMYWQYCVRPVEEQDLESRFEDEFQQYKMRVRCWIPNGSIFKWS